jgi:hypothetical protein
MVSVPDGAGSRVDISPDNVVGIYKHINGTWTDVTQQAQEEATKALNTPSTEESGVLPEDENLIIDGVDEDPDEAKKDR